MLRSSKVEALIQRDKSQPMSYTNIIQKGMSRTIEDIRKSKWGNFFGGDLKCALTQIPDVVDLIENVHLIPWKNSPNGAVDYNAKVLSTTAWRHFRLSWHDYMNMVILVSPRRRDRLILEKIKILGPPQSINSLRKAFALGDARSRRLFFEIYYTPRIAKLNAVSFPGTLIFVDKNGTCLQSPALHIVGTPYVQPSHQPSTTNIIPRFVPGSTVIDLTSTQNLVINTFHFACMRIKALPQSSIGLQSSRGRVIGGRKMPT